MFYQNMVDGWPNYKGNTVIVAKDSCSPEVMDYPHTFKYPFKDLNDMMDMANWAQETCQGPWLVGYERSGFFRKEDAMHFRLRWL